MNVKEELPEKLSKEDMDLIHKSIRPKWMPFELYKELQKASRIRIKKHLEGKHLYVAKEYVTEMVDNKEVKLVKSYGSYKKNVKKTA